MDVGFKKVYTPAILTLVYALALPALLVAWVVVAIVGFVVETWVGWVATVVVGPAMVIGGMLVLRIGCELVLLGIKAADDIHAMRTAGVALSDAGRE